MKKPRTRTIADVLPEAMRLRDFSQSDLARKSGVPQPTISKILSGDKQNIGIDNAAKLAAALGLSVGQLLGIENLAGKKSPREDGMVPLLDDRQILSGDLASDRWVPTFDRHSDRAFAYLMRGESMANPAGAPSYPEGYTVVIDPDVIPANRDCVLVVVGDRAMVRQLVLDPAGSVLRPLNPEPVYRTVALEDWEAIIGVVVEAGYVPRR